MSCAQHLFIYTVFPWAYVPSIMNQVEGDSVSASFRRGGRVLSGVAGLALGGTAGYFAAAAAYVSGVDSETHYQNAVGNPYPEKVISADAKVKAGVGATFTFYAVTSHVTVLSMAVGGLVTDALVGTGEVCWNAATACCQATARKCVAAGACIKKTFCCSKEKGPQEEIRMEQPKIPDAAGKV